MFGRKKRRITRLLIVEDEPLVAFDTEHFLRDEAFEIVATVDRVADAMVLIRAIDGDGAGGGGGGGGVIDLVLVDVNLADGSGMDVARAAHDAGVPVMFVTGECPAGAQDVAIGCLSKPFAQRNLLASIDAVESIIDGKRPKRLPSGFRAFEPA